MWTDSIEDAILAVRCGQLVFPCTDIGLIKVAVSLFGWSGLEELLLNQQNRGKGCGPSSSTTSDDDEPEKVRDTEEFCVTLLR